MVCGLCGQLWLSTLLVYMYGPFLIYIILCYLAGCGGEVIVHFDEGVLESPNFPQYYAPNMRYHE